MKPLLLASYLGGVFKVTYKQQYICNLIKILLEVSDITLKNCLQKPLQVFLPKGNLFEIINTRVRFYLNYF